MGRLLSRWAVSWRALASHPPLRLTLFLALSVLAAWPAVQQAGEMNVFHDAQFLSAYERHARLTWLRFGQLPLWDPFSCGGMYGLGAPQTRYASPFALASLLLGVDAGASLLAALLPALAMEGMFRYARSWGARPTAALAAAPLFPLCGWFGFCWHYGWVHFFSFCLVPWVLVTLRGALRGDRRATLGCALWVGIAVGFGGTYTLPMLVLPGLVEVVDALGRRRALEGPRARAQRVLAGAGATALLVAGVGAYRLWPLLESAGATLRTIGGLPHHDFAWVYRALFVPLERSDDPDGYFFVAFWVVPFALLAAWRRRRGVLVALVGLSVWLSLGHVSAFAPFSLLRKLPIYEALRAPGRYLLLCVLMLALLAALGLSDAAARARGSLGRRAQAIVSAVGAALLMGAWVAAAGVAQQQFAAVQTEPAPEARDDVPFRQSRGNRWMMSHFAAEGMGSLGCGEAYPVPMSQRLRGDLPAEEYLLASLADTPLEGGTVTRHRWSPNALHLDVRTPTAARLAINQNYHPGWHANVGRVASYEGLLSVELPAGRHQVELRFLPRSGLGGLAVSVLSVLGGLYFAFARPRRVWLRSVSLALGPVGFVALLAVWPEPAFTRPLPRDSDHQLVYVRGLPEEAHVLDARFDVPLRLEGAVLPSRPVPRGRGEVELSLYLRRVGPLGPAHSLFVHVTGPGGQRVGADHAALSSIVYLPRMPEGQLVRDRFLVPLPRPSAPGRWQVQVGLWDAFGDGSRRPVKSHAPNVKVQGDAITVGHFEVESAATVGPFVPRSPPRPTRKETAHE